MHGGAEYLGRGGNVGVSLRAQGSAAVLEIARRLTEVEYLRVGVLCVSIVIPAKAGIQRGGKYHLGCGGVAEW